MRAISFTPLVAGLAVTAALAQPNSGERTSCVPRDHYDPGALAEFAHERTREGDLGTARIMLARAARISPNDARIARAPGEPGAARGPTAADASPAQAEPRSPAAPLPPAPPPLWPAKTTP